MTDAVSDPERLLDEAIDLTIRLQTDPANPVTLQMIRAWRNRSPEHEHIWRRVAEVHGGSGKILGEQRKAEERRKLGLTRRNIIVGGTLGVGAIAVGSAFGPDIATWMQADYMTSTAELRQVSLIDGTKVTVGPKSAIAVADRQTGRRVQLLRGMSFFHAAPARGRAFVVEAGALTVAGADGAFDVSVDAGVISVSVEQGIVEARAATAGFGRIAGGEWMSFDPSSHVIERGEREAGQIASWRNNVIVAEKETVAALVARIARWQPGRVVIAAPYVGSQRVSGVFDLNDPYRALQAVVHPAGGHVRQVSTLLTVISPI